METYLPLSPRFQSSTVLILFFSVLFYTVADSSTTNQGDITDQCHHTKEQGNFRTRVRKNQGEKDTDIIAAYNDACGHIQLARLKMRELSDSWIWGKTIYGNNEHRVPSQGLVESYQTDLGFKDNVKHSTDEHYYEESRVKIAHSLPMTPVKNKRWMMRQERRNARATKLVQQDKGTDNRIVSAAIERSRGFDTTVKGKYSIWKKEYENPNSDSTLKLMRDQIIMAKVYFNIAKSMKKTVIYNALVKHFRENQQAIGKANSDDELQLGALDRAKAMGRVLSVAKDQLYDCPLVGRKLRAMLQSTECGYTEEKMCILDSAHCQNSS